VEVPNPWDHLDELDVVLVRGRIPERGRYYHRQHVIVVRRGLRIVEERAILWHEIVHAENRDRPCGDTPIAGKTESWCWRQAARRAIPLQAILAALDWSLDRSELADQLKTTEELLDVRTAWLHPAERGAIHRRLAAREDAA
jgi:hypothetical protein